MAETVELEISINLQERVKHPLSMACLSHTERPTLGLVTCSTQTGTAQAIGYSARSIGRWRRESMDHRRVNCPLHTPLPWALASEMLAR